MGWPTSTRKTSPIPERALHAEAKGHPAGTLKRRWLHWMRYGIRRLPAGGLQEHQRGMKQQWSHQSWLVCCTLKFTNDPPPLLQLIPQQPYEANIVRRILEMRKFMHKWVSGPRSCSWLTAQLSPNTPFMAIRGLQTEDKFSVFLWPYHPFQRARTKTLQKTQSNLLLKLSA